MPMTRLSVLAASLLLTASFSLSQAFVPSSAEKPRRELAGGDRAADQEVCLEAALLRRDPSER